MNDIIKFIDGEIEVSVKLKDETVWITQKQMCKLFGRDKSVISRHIRNIFKNGELQKDSVVAKIATTQNKKRKKFYFLPPFGVQLPLPFPEKFPVVLGIFGAQLLLPFGAQLPLPFPEGFPVVLGILGAQFAVFAIFSPFIEFFAFWH